MNRKEVLYAVIGGCVGAVLTMVMCSFSPVGAQQVAPQLSVVGVISPKLRAKSMAHRNMSCACHTLKTQW